MSTSDTPRPNSSCGTGTPQPFATSLEQKPIWAALYENVRDAWFAPRLPELELTSVAVPVPDRTAVRTNRWAVGTSTILNGGALAILILMGLGKFMSPGPNPAHGRPVKLTDFGLFVPRAQNGGGGGGANDLIDPITGRNPRFEKTPLAPPQVPVLQDPQLAIQSAIAVPLDIKLPDHPELPNIGVYQSANVTLDSQGQGTKAGIGSNTGGGDGPGNGIGFGPGSEQGAGGGPYVPGIGGVTLPVPLVSPDAEFSDEARRAKYQGVCAISIVVDTQGYPRNLRVVRSLGMGLDEKALEAVRKYRFKPALKNGKPVPAMMTIEVNFRLY